MGQLIWSRHDHYQDWNAKRRVLVLAAKTGYALFIIEGHYSAACGVRGFGRIYTPAKLALKGPSRVKVDTYFTDYIAEGRITRSVIRSLSERIDAVFGDGVAERIVPSGTLYLP